MNIDITQYLECQALLAIRWVQYFNQLAGARNSVLPKHEIEFVITGAAIHRDAGKLLFRTGQVIELLNESATMAQSDPEDPISIAYTLVGGDPLPQGLAPGNIIYGEIWTHHDTECEEPEPAPHGLPIFVGTGS